MHDADLPLRAATTADIATIHALVESSYRGKSGAGWTSEADLFDGPRTDAAALQAIIDDPRQLLLIAEDAAGIFASVLVTAKDADTACLGLLSVDPRRQAGGIGRRMIAAAETAAVRQFGATCIEMTVIDQRFELVDYYGRRGYLPTGEVRPLPPDARGGLVPMALRVLSRALPAAGA